MTENNRPLFVPGDQEEADRNADRIARASHAIQTGIAYEMSRGDEATHPKHLRTGIDTAKAEQAGLASLLISMGVFTIDQYYAAIADALEAEVARYESIIEQKYGVKVTLS
jgi:hypothetical protein